MVAGTIMAPEEAAKNHLEKMFESKANSLAHFNKPQSINGSKIDFSSFQTIETPFTGNRMVKFRQKINNISVYGSCINVEIDKDYNLVSITSFIDESININTVAKTSAAEAIKIAEDYTGNKIPPSVIPLLYIYFDENQWKLVYFIKHIIGKKGDSHLQQDDNQHSCKHSYLNYINIIIDANSGKMIKEAPAAMSLEITTTGDDDLQYKIAVREHNSFFELFDEDLNVITYDLNFESYNNTDKLPGSIIRKNGDGWLSAGVNAHHNACVVAKFLKEVLQRNGIDNKGMSLISSVRCVETPGIQNWNNAAWLSELKQMIYGQIKSGQTYKTLALSLDVVAHEIIHGVTQFTSSLDYENQPGALNESYSDILGIIISNYDNKNQDTWNWELGEGVNGIPFRDISTPEKYAQPSHMQNYRDLPNNRPNDYGGVHINSGIHNKAAYNLIMSKDTNGAYLFTIEDCARIFYLGLIQLSNSSGFSDSYKSILNAANSLFKHDTKKDIKIKAIKSSFESVGIF